MRVIDDGAERAQLPADAVSAIEALLGADAGRGGPGAARSACAARHGDLAALARAPAAELARRLGLPIGDAGRLAAAFALGREVERARAPRGPLLGRPDAVARVVAPDLRGLTVETFLALHLDARHRLVARTEVSRGTLTSAPVHPREVFGPALRAGAAAVVVAHNHPSGDPEPSAADLDVTKRLAAAGQLVGVPLLDHLVWADGGWVSLRERGAIDAGGGAGGVPP